MHNKVNVIGAGLAGSEAAYQLAQRGINVTLYEQKPNKMSPAHSYAGFGELVCSNSLRSDRLANAAGLLKKEMRILNSLIMQAADASSVPAGGALAVDRVKFSDYITATIKGHKNIEVVYEEVSSLEALEGMTIVATGPLTSEALSKDIGRHIGADYLHFSDAAAPIITKESIDFSKVFWGSRYEQGNDYINCPMTKEQYDAFYNALITAEEVELHGFEDDKVFESCMPVEVMAKRGYQTLLFGPLKPVGFTLADGTMPYAIVQLRKEDNEDRLFNLVGFQTHLKFGEQKRVFSMIPGLENAEFARYGVMHKNTFINGPQLLDKYYRLKNKENIYLAGQITGVEGYLESTASGLYAGINAAYFAKGENPPVLTSKTAIGALAEYVSSSAATDYQPMHITYGIMAEPEGRFRKRTQKREQVANIAIEEIAQYVASLDNEK